MNYRIKPGVVLFNLFDRYFLFPSRKANARISAVITLTPELSTYLQGQGNCPVASSLSSENKEKLNRLVKLGYIEEY